jgi:transcriptional regulator with XRE-family HTH domain
LAESSEVNRQRLGRELRVAREAAGLTQDGIASLLRCRQGKIAKIEGKLVAISPDDLEDMLHYYKLPASKKAELRELHAHSVIARAVPGYPVRSDAFAKLVSAETDAAEILSWHSERVPGPLQHIRYMLKQFQLDRGGQRDSVRAAMAARQTRLNVFYVRRPPRYRVILSQSSFYRLPGGWSRELELDQIGQLQSLLTMNPQFELMILPYTANVAYVDTDFAVLRFRRDSPATAHQDDFVYLEHAGGGQLMKDTTKFIEHWEVLAQAALTRDATVAFLAQRFNELVDSHGLSWLP